MDRKTFIQELHIISQLLDKLAETTQQKLEENRKVRKLLNLPNTVHNKTSLKNYLNSTKQSASK
jgi:hypothetical protein